MSLCIRHINRIIKTVCKKIVSRQFITDASNDRICVQESAYLRVIVTTIEVVESCFSVIVVPAVPKRVYRADCGSRLCMGTKQRNGKYYHHYRCNNHYLNPDKCPKPHQISYTVLYKNILERIQQLTKAVENDEEFYALVQIKTADNLPSDSVQKERYSLEKRMAELSGKVRKLFDSHADGVIDDRNYEMLMKDIQAEQETLEQKLSALQSKISQQHNTELSVEQFR